MKEIVFLRLIWNRLWDCLHSNFYGAYVLLEPVFAGGANDRAAVRFLCKSEWESEAACRFLIDSLLGNRYLCNSWQAERIVGRMDREMYVGPLAVRLL